MAILDAQYMVPSQTLFNQHKCPKPNYFKNI